jgi:hypothetical protein
MAVILSKGNKQVIYLDPVSGWELSSQNLFGLIRGLRRNIAKPVADAMDMGIYANSGFAEAEGYHKVCGFAPDPLEIKKFINVIRHNTMKIIDQLPGYQRNLLGFGVIEAGWIDQLRYLIYSES